MNPKEVMPRRSSPYWELAIGTLTGIPHRNDCRALGNWLKARPNPRSPPEFYEHHQILGRLLCLRSRPNEDCVDGCARSTANDKSNAGVGVSNG